MNALEIRGLTKVYASGAKALDDLSLTVKQGDFFALLGPNGAGKSTLIGVLTSLVRKTSGSVKMLGVDIDKNFPEARTKIGVVPQEFNFNLFERVWQVLVFQAGYYGISRKIALSRIDELLFRLGLDDQKESQVRALSGGMKRRLMIARALIHNPQLLILDEPTAGVDVELRHLTWQFVSEINKKGVTIILTTHYLEEAENLCRNIAIIDQGKIIENTTTRKLLQKLDSQTIELELAQKPTGDIKIPGFQCELIDDNVIKIQCSRDVNLNALFAALNRKKITVTGMVNRSARLEELFVRLTTKSK